MFVPRFLRVSHWSRLSVFLALFLSAIKLLSLLYCAETPRVIITGLRSGFPTEYTSPLPGEEDFAQIVASLWKPYVHDINNDTFTTSKGREYNITSHLWNRPLGKDVLILDVDTRFDKVDHGSALEGDNLTPRRVGRLHHYIYSLIHGYDYRLVHAPRFWLRNQTWVKVPIIKKALAEGYKFVVFLDSDANFAEPQIPLEWLLNLWDFKPNTLLSMAEDPNEPRNFDAKGRVLWNTGFIIAQQSERTQELFQAWEDCPAGVQFPSCGYWKQEWPHEQGAFGNYLRYAYNVTDELRVISCLEGNGSPFIGIKECEGVFVAHHWSQKRRTIDYVQEMISKGLTWQLEDGNLDLVSKAFARLRSTSFQLDKALSEKLSHLD